MVSTDRINLVVAHSAEAKPVCNMFGMRAVGGSLSFPLFRNAAGLSLIVSGMGKLSAAAATSYLAGLQSQTHRCAWLNIGIAGHQSMTIGHGLLAHKITDATSGHSYYPPPLIALSPSSAVITVDTPESDYPQPAAYDMEAAAFYACATKYMTSELVQVFKIVSDNQQHTLAQFDISQVAGLIGAQQTQIRAIINKLDSLLDQYRDVYSLPVAYSNLIQQYDFTQTQRAQLRRLCERFKALGLSGELESICEHTYASRSAILTALRSRLSQPISN